MYMPTQNAPRDTSGKYNTFSKLLMAIGYLFLLAIIPNVFGWALIVLSISSSAFQELLFEPWLQRDGALLFNTCCWKVQSVFDLLTEPVYSGIFLALQQLGLRIGVSVGTIGAVILSMPAAYLAAVLGWKVREWLNAMLLVCELRVEVVVLVVATALILSRRVTDSDGARDI